MLAFYRGFISSLQMRRFDPNCAFKLLITNNKTRDLTRSQKKRPHMNRGPLTSIDNNNFPTSLFPKQTKLNKTSRIDDLMQAYYLLMGDTHLICYLVPRLVQSHPRFSQRFCNMVGCYSLDFCSTSQVVSTYKYQTQLVAKQVAK
jgi:hypothetical protein